MADQHVRCSTSINGTATRVTPRRFSAALFVLAAMVLAVACSKSDPDATAVAPGAAAAASDSLPGVVSSQEVTSVQSGAWSDGSTWSTGAVPEPWADVSIAVDHIVTVDQSADIFGMDLAGELVYATDASIMVRSRANVVVTGTLRMGWDSSVQHELRFVEVDESAMLGASMTVLETDVGLWVMGEGRLLAEGAEKRGWTNSVGGIEAGTSQVEVVDALGWMVGDAIVISPTKGDREDELDNNYGGFHEATITEVDGNVVTFDTPTTNDHPHVNDKWTAEVMNLTRTVVIGGVDYEHKPHVFFHSAKPSHLRFVEVVNVGPGVVFDDGWDVDGQVLGRYGLHWHHNGDGSIGTIVEGVSLHRFGNKGYVPHVSHGITFRDTIAYDGGDAAYWWDANDPSHDILWDTTIGAKIGSPNGVYFLGTGDNVEVRNSVAVGSLVKSNSGGFEWENNDTGSWEFTGNIAHNLRGNGIRVWQNTQENHVLSDFAVYYVDDIAVRIGAYINNYHLKNFELYGFGEAGLELLSVPRQPHHGLARPAGLIVENAVIDGAGISPGPSIAFRNSAKPGTWPILVRNVDIRGRSGQEEPAIWLFEEANDKKVDLINVTIGDGPTPDFLLANDSTTGEGDGQSWLRIQNDDESYRLRPGDQNLDAGAEFIDAWNAWRIDIPRFAPDSFGNGTGLLGEFFNDLEMTELHFQSIDPYIEFFEEEFPIHYTIEPDVTGARWSGFIEAQETGTHSFEALGDLVRLTVDGRVLVDTWADGSDEFEATIDLVAGERYEILLEIGHRRLVDDELFFEADLMWTRPGDSPPEYIPQSQLYPPEGIEDGPFTANDPVISPEPGVTPDVYFSSMQIMHADEVATDGGADNEFEGDDLAEDE